MHEVSEMLTKKQFFIATKDARPMGKAGMANVLDVEMVGFFDEIAKAVLQGDSDDIFAVQWAVSRLDEGERDAIEKGCETRH
jgi:hypothetical protein